MLKIIIPLYIATQLLALLVFGCLLLTKSSERKKEKTKENLDKYKEF